jgi:AsmA protein
MKKILLAILTILVICVGFVLIAPKLVTIEAVRRSITREVAGWSGRALTYDGTPTVAFTPYPTVTFEKVQIGSGTGSQPLVVMESLQAELSLVSLLVGHVRPSLLELENPVFHFAVDAKGTPNWTLPRSLRGGSELGRLIVHAGTVHYAASGKPEIVLSGVNADINWPDPAATASLKGSATWQDETIDFNGSIGTPLDFVAGNPTALRFAIASTPLRASFNGTVRNLVQPEAEGKLSVTTPSIRRLASFFDVPMGEGSTLGSASIESQASLALNTLTFSDAKISVDGNEGEGVLSLGFNKGRPAIQGTLAFESLDLSAYAEALASAVAAARAAPDQPFPVSALNEGDVDLRVSASQVLLGSARLGRTAASATIRDERLTLSVGEAQLYGGRLSASLSASLQDETASTSLQGRVDGLPVRAALSDLFGIGHIDGTGSGTVNLSAHGTSWNGLMASLSGSGRATIADGSFDGVNIGALSQKITADGTISGNLLGGSTKFTQADGDFTIDADQVTASSIVVKGGGYTIELSGEAPLQSPTLSARGDLVIERSTGATSTAINVPFIVGGSWDHPTLVPDFSGLSRRSGSRIPGPAEGPVRTFARSFLPTLR